MLKKIFLAVMSAMLFSVQVCVAAPIDVSEDDKQYEAISMLIELGIMDKAEDGSFRADEYLTRAELAKIAAVIYHIADGGTSSDGRYVDVAEGNAYARYIYACTENGLMQGVGENKFAPDMFVTGDQLNAVILRLLGYRDFAAAFMEYPEGYWEAAKIIGIDKYLKQTNEYIKRADIATFVYKALEMPVAEMDYIANDTLKISESGDTTLSKKYMGVEKISGRVTGNHISSMPAGSRVPAGYVEIDGQLLLTGNTGVEWELGRYVTAYAHIDGDTWGDVIGYILPPKYNKQIYAALRDVVKERSNSRQLSVLYKDKIKTYKLADDVVVLLNGEALSDYSQDLFNFDLGEIYLVDTNNQGSYDLLIIESPKSLIFNKYSEVSNTIYSKYDEEKIEMPIEAQIDVYIDGETAQLSQLEEWMSIFVFNTADQEYYKICASSKTVTGSCSSLTEDTITISQDQYNISSVFEHYTSKTGGVKIGREYVFIVDCYGEVAAIVDTEDASEKYAFITNAYINDDDEAAYIKIYTQDNQKKTYKLKDKVKLGTRTKSIAIEAKDILNGNYGITYDGFHVKKQLIKYTVNTEGEINYISVAEDNTNIQDYDNHYFTLDYEKTGSGSLYVYNKMIGGMYCIDAENTIIFNIPAVYENGSIRVADNIDDIYVNRNSIVNGDLLNFMLYDVDCMHTPKVILRYITDSNNTVGVVGTWETAIVERVSECILENGDVGYGIDYYESGKKQYLECDKETVTIRMVNGQWAEFAGVPVSELRCGDVVQISKSAKTGMAKDIHLLGRASDIENDFERTAGNTVTTASSVTPTHIQTIPGTVIDSDDKNILVSTVAGNGEACERSIIRSARTNYYLYDRSRGKISVIDSNEVSRYDKVFVRLYDWSCYTVFVIR